MPLAALVVGNRSESGYKYPTSIKLENAKLSAPEKNSAGLGYCAMYVCQNDRTNTVKVEGSVEYVGNPRVNLGDMNYATFAVDKVYVSDFSQFQCVISEGLIPNIVLLNDLNLSGIGFSVLEDISFDLNRNTLTAGYIKMGRAKATFCNGNLVVNNSSEVGIELKSGSRLCLDNVEYRTSAKQSIATGKFVKDVMIDVVNGSKVFANVYGIATNAYVNKETYDVSEGINVNVVHSRISAEDSNNGDSTAILFNVKGSV